MTLKLLQLGKTEYGNFEISNKNTFFDILKLETKDLTIGNKPLNYRHLQEKSSSNVIHSTTRIEIHNQSDRPNHENTSNVIHSTTRIEISKVTLFRVIESPSNVIHSTTRIEIKSDVNCIPLKESSNVIHSTTRIEIYIVWKTQPSKLIFECNPLNNKD